MAVVPGSLLGARAGSSMAMTEEEKESMIRRILGPAMSSLAYAGETLDKPGRALRGLLAGRPSELMNLIPFSDTVGLTDPRESVGGRQLLEQHGVLGPNKPGFDMGDLAGFAAEVALDPLTYTGIGTLTKAGQAASKTGQLAKGLAPGIRAGHRSLLSFGVPFGSKAAVGTGETAARIGDKLIDQPVGKLARSRVGRTARRLFDAPVQGADTALGQDIMSDAWRKMNREMGDVELGFRETQRGLVEAGALDDAGQDLLRQLAEAPGDMFPELAGKAATLHPRGKELAETATKLRDVVGKQSKELLDMGLDTKVLDDIIEYFPRYHHQTDPNTFVSRFKDVYKRRADEVFKGRKEFLKGIPDGTIGANRVIAQYGGWGKTMTPDEAVLRIAEDAYGASASTAKELPKEIRSNAKKFVNWLKKLEPGKYNDANPFFNADPLTDMVVRSRFQKRASTTTDAILKMSSVAAKNMDEVLPRGWKDVVDGVEHIPLRDVLQDAGFKFGTKRSGKPIMTLDEALGQKVPAPTFLEDQLAKRMGTIKNTDTGKLAIPVDIADDVKRFVKTWQNPEELAPVLKAYDASLNAFKVGVTQMWPGFHFRNLISALYYNYISGANTPKGIVDDTLSALKLRLGNLDQAIPPELAKQGIQNWKQLLDEAVSHRVAFVEGGQAAETVQGIEDVFNNVASGRVTLKSPGERTGVATGWLKGFGRLPERVATSRAGKAVETATRPLSMVAKQGIRVGSAVEDTVRLAHYIGRRKQGFDAAEAAASTFKWHFDYSSNALTEFDRKVMKRMIPFWRFTKGNVPLVIRELMQKPGGVMAQSIRASGQARQNEGFVPGYIGEGLAIPLPGGEGARFLSGTGLPFEQPFEQVALEPDPGSAFGISLRKSIGRTLEKQAGGATPLISTPYTLASGKDPFFGRDLTDLYRYPTENIMTNVLLARSPASRAITSTRKAFDERKNPAVRALNLMTGLQITDLPGGMDRARDIEARRALMEYMKERPDIKSFERFYVRPEDKDKLSEFDTDALRLQNALLQRGTKQQRQLLAGPRR